MLLFDICTVECHVVVYGMYYPPTDGQPTCSPSSLVKERERESARASELLRCSRARDPPSGSSSARCAELSSAALFSGPLGGCEDTSRHVVQGGVAVSWQCRGSVVSRLRP